MKTLAYVNLAPDNGGIVLNVSEGGFSFQAVSPVQQVGTIHFWCSLPDNDRIDAIGELAWTDATRKIGGLRLTSTPAEVREQILKLGGLPPSPPPTHEGPAAQLHDEVPSALTLLQSEKHVAPAPDNALQQKTPLQETRATPPARSISSPPVSVRRIEKAIWTVSQTRFSEFLRYSLTLLVVLAIAGAGILLSSYRRQIGASLTWLGGRFAGTPLQQTVSPVPARDTESSSSPESLNPAAMAPERPLDTQTDELTRRKESDLENPAASSLTRTQSSVSPLSAKVSKPSRVAPTAVGPSVPSSPVSASTTSASSTGTSPDAVGSSWFGPSHPLSENSGSTGDLAVEPVSLSVYFEVGNFKDPVWAAKATDALAQSGFQAIVVRKGHLWMNSYHVLVGPFGTGSDAETAQTSLEFQGFKPRPTKIIPNKSQ